MESWSVQQSWCSPSIWGPGDGMCKEGRRGLRETRPVRGVSYTRTGCCRQLGSSSSASGAGKAGTVPATGKYPCVPVGRVVQVVSRSQFKNYLRSPLTCINYRINKPYVHFGDSAESRDIRMLLW